MFSKGKFVPHNKMEKKPPTMKPMAKPPAHEPPMGEKKPAGNMPHASEMHGSTPHPATGVHGVMITHHEGHAMTHTHHDGGAVEPMKHANMAEAHAHAQSQLPSGADEQQDAEQGDSGMGSDTELAGLGGMTGDAA